MKSIKTWPLWGVICCKLGTFFISPSVYKKTKSHLHSWCKNSTVYLNYKQCFQKLNWKDTLTLGLQSKMFAKFHIMKDAISKIVKKLSSDISYWKTGGIFQYFVTFSQQKNHLCIIDRNLKFNYVSIP